MRPSTDQLYQLLTGQSESHIVWLGKTGLHQGVKTAFDRLVKRAAKDGFKLAVASSFRSFEKQLLIFNEKCEGKRPILSHHGDEALDVAKLNPIETVKSILRWSALPGASRHHWGTDFDIFDENSRIPQKKIDLTPAEGKRGGPFHLFSKWLSEHLSKHLEEESFFRPYSKDQGGISPEWWHISYRPIADEFLEKLTQEMLRKALASATIHHKAVILKELPFIHKNYVMNISKT